jgi:hypothetical protein
MIYDNYGIPIGERSMKIIDDRSRKQKCSGRVKDSVWRNEKKPWGHPPYPGRASSHGSKEVHYLYRTALACGGNIANLGVFRGVSTSALAHGVKERGDGKVYAVDFFDRNTCFTVEHITEVFEERGTLPWVEFCKGHTQDWAVHLNHLKFNFIFVDADHQYESTLGDFKTWEPLLAPRGLIAFHDIGLNTVNKVIEEELSDWEIVDFVCNIKTFRRKP